MAEGSRLEVDGETIQRDGVVRWEDHFEKDFPGPSQ